LQSQHQTPQCLKNHIKRQANKLLSGIHQSSPIYTIKTHTDTLKKIRKEKKRKEKKRKENKRRETIGTGQMKHCVVV